VILVLKGGDGCVTFEWWTLCGEKSVEIMKRLVEVVDTS